MRSPRPRAPRFRVGSFSSTPQLLLRDVSSRIRDLGWSPRRHLKRILEEGKRGRGGGERRREHTNLLTQVLQLVFGLATELVSVGAGACLNLHLGASVLQLQLQRFAGLNVGH